MRYTYIGLEDAKKIWKDAGKGEWEYISEKDIEKFQLVPADIIGDVGLYDEESEAVLTHRDKEIFIQPVKMKLEGKEEILGYLPCEDESGKRCYVRILKKRSRKWLLPLLLVLLLLIGGGAWYLMNQKEDFLDEAAIAYQMPNAIKNNNPEEIVIPVLTDLTLEKGESSVKATFANPDGNPCYFRYTVTLNDTGEVIYQSKLIEPGTAIMEFTPNKKLSKGKHSIEISVKTASLNDREQEMNGGAMDCNLTVK